MLGAGSVPKKDIEEEDYIYKVPCQARETISLRDSTYISNQKKKKKKYDDYGEMKEPPDIPKDRNTNTYSNEVELDPRRQSYTSSTVGELNFGNFPLASLKPQPDRISKQTDQS